jgi:hypothetical protein
MRGLSLLAITAVLLSLSSRTAAQTPLPTELPPVTPVAVTPVAGATETAPVAPPSTPAPPPGTAPGPSTERVDDALRLVQGNPNPNSNLRPADLVRQEMQPDPELQWRPLLKTWALSFTYLPGGQGSRTFGIESLEASATFQLPFLDGYAPLLVRPGAGVHFWQQPKFGFPFFSFGLPETVYDLYLDLGWQPRIADWLILDLGITPGLYTDFDNTGDDAFRLRGRAVGIFCYSDQFQIVAGAAALNRDRFNWIPVFGALWTPSPDWNIALVFPESKIAYRLKGDACMPQWWLYLATELGGGVWSVRRGGVFNDSVEYDDWRINLGVEWKSPHGVNGLVEVGYVFSRQLYFQRPDFVFDLNDTLMVRVGLIF